MKDVANKEYIIKDALKTWYEIGYIDGLREKNSVQKII